MPRYTVHRVNKTGEKVEQIGYVDARHADEADEKACHQHGPRVSVEEDADTTDPAATIVIYKLRGDDTADVYHESSACAEGDTELVRLEEARGDARPCQNCVTETY
jgi:hypothetical protein